MTNVKKSDVKAVTSPLSFAKKDFATWLESIESGIPKYVHFGTDWIIKLPKDIAEPDIKKKYSFMRTVLIVTLKFMSAEAKRQQLLLKNL